MPIRVPVKGQTIRKTYTCPRYPEDPVIVDLLPLDTGGRNALRALGFGPMRPIQINEEGLSDALKELPEGADTDRFREVLISGARSMAEAKHREEQEAHFIASEAALLAAGRAAFLTGVRVIEGFEFVGGPEEPTPEDAAGFLWDYADAWFTEAICNDLVCLNSATGDDLGN